MLEAIVVVSRINPIRVALGALLMMPLGVLLFVLSFVVLWINEGLPLRAEIAAASTEVSADDNSARVSGIISATGPLRTTGPVADPLYVASTSDWLDLHRVVEVYAWHQIAEVQEERRPFWFRKRTTTYTYVLDWTSSPQDSSQFHQPDGHQNREVPVPSVRFRGPGLQLGAWSLQLPDWSPPLPGLQRIHTSELDFAPATGAVTPVGHYLYLGDAAADNPAVGDVRISFHGSPQGIVATMFGAIDKGTLAPHSTRKSMFFDLLAGQREGAIEILAYEDTMRLVLLRVLGFAMMWGGLFLLGSMVFLLLDILPFAGTVGRVVWALITLPTALLFGATTVVLAIVASSAWMTAGVLLAGVAVVWAVYTIGPRIQARNARRAASRTASDAA